MLACACMHEGNCKEVDACCRRLSGQSQTSAARLVHGRPHAGTVQVGGAAGRRRHRGGARRRARAARRRRAPAGASRVCGRACPEHAQIEPANHRSICCQLAVSLTCKHRWCSSLHVCACLAIAGLHNTSAQKVCSLACDVRCHAVRHRRLGARAVKYVRTFPPDKQPSLVHAYQRSSPKMAAKLTQQHVSWLREYEPELAGRDLPDAMHCLYTRAQEYVYRKTGSRPAARAFRRSMQSLCCHLSALGHWRACMYGDQSYQNLRSQHIIMRHLQIIVLHSCTACAWALCSKGWSQQCCSAAQRCIGAGPSRVLGHHVLAYLGEHVSRSKTPIVDALLVLYPAFAAALTLHQVQLFCAQELKQLSDKDAPLRVHYLYSRWYNCGQRMLKRRAADEELDRSGVPSHCASSTVLQQVQADSVSCVAPC